MSVGKAAANAGIWAWEHFGNQVKPIFIAFLKRKWDDAIYAQDKIKYLDKGWKNFSWGSAAKRYKEQMKKVYGHIRIIGTTEPIPIANVFTDVFILEKPQAIQRFDISQLQKIQKEPEKLDAGKRIRGLKVVISQKGHRLYILGKPGAGKTTFMKYLVHQTITASELNKLPIFVTLRDWDAQKTNLIDHMAKQFAVCNFPNAYPFIEYLLESGNAIVLLDGLDEVPEQNDLRKVTIDRLREFFWQYQNTQMIITCRVAATNYEFDEFTYIEMADFNEKQVSLYARKWFDSEIEKAEKFIIELRKPENRGLRELGHSPLLLSMICLAYNDTLKIPKRRVELYEEALDALLKKWDASRNIQRDEIYKKLSLGRKRQMFSRIGAEGFEKGKIFFPMRQLAQSVENYLKNLPPDDTNEVVEGETVLKSISAQHGILVERAKGIYAFAHLTFQEYYTAKYIVDNAHLGTLNNLIHHLPDQRWREVFLMTVSLLNEADQYLENLLIYTDKLLDGNDALRDVQEWVERKSQNCKIELRGGVKSLYWYLALDITHFDTKNWINSFEFARALMNIREFTYSVANNQNFLPTALSNAQKLVDFNILAVDYYRDLSTELDSLAHYLDTQEDHISEMEKGIILDIALMFALSISFLFTLESRFSELQAHYEDVSNFFEQLKNYSNNVSPPLGKALNSISIPKEYSTTFDWELFEKNFRKMLIQNNDIGHYWSLTETNLQTLKKYLVSNSVILDSLQIAYLENRTDILKKLFKRTDK